MKHKYLLIYLLVFLSAKTTNAQTYKIWGTAYYGGSKDFGVVFQLNRDGTGYKIMHNFTTKTGTSPTALIKGTGNKLYGLTATGGQHSQGVLYSINTSTNAYTVLHHFTAEEGSPTSLFLAGNGKIYGTADEGPGDPGRLFKFNPTNNAFAVVFKFGGILTGTGSSPGKLMQASNGLLYGMTSSGGFYLGGVIYSFNTVNNVFSKLFQFVQDLDDFTCDICSPYDAFAQDTNGLLYSFGSLISTSYGVDLLFSFNTVNNAVTTISILNSTTGTSPATLLRTTPGIFYGLAENGGTNHYGTLYLYNTWVGYPLTQINFNGAGNGAYPVGSLMRSADTKLYGATAGGGLYGSGTIFNYSGASNVLTKIYDFKSPNGRVPGGDLVEIATGKAVAAGTIAMNAETKPVTTLVTVSPNPVLQGQVINIKFSSAAAAHYTITLTDASGKELLIRTGASVQGINLLKIEIGNLPKGLYMIAIQNDSFKNVSKLIVQ